MIEQYRPLILWIALSIVILIVMKKIIKKAIFIVIGLGIAIAIGCIPFSTIEGTVDTAIGSYNVIKEQAALWTTVTNEENPDEKVIYILNSLPVMLNSDGVEIEDSDFYKMFGLPEDGSIPGMDSLMELEKSLTGETTTEEEISQ